MTDEFNKLYDSLFKKAESHIAVINALSGSRKGMTRLELINKTKLSNNGNLTTLLKELETCEFIRSYRPFGKEKKNKMFQLTDQFSLFHLHFMNTGGDYGRNYWMQMIGKQEYIAWSGYAFETVCLHHIEQIVNALGINGTFYSPCSWSYRPPETMQKESFNGHLSIAAARQGTDYHCFAELGTAEACRLRSVQTLFSTKTDTHARK